jgi:hypothetical protein
MKRAQKIVIGAFTASLAASLVASQIFASPVAPWLGAPAVALSGWAAIGHLVTMDDEAPGGWSNPEKSKAIWRKSLQELAVKLVIFGATVWLALLLPM